VNVLITGSNGFIGKNLKKRLSQNKEIKIFEFNRNDNLINIEKIIHEIAFIFHLAGEVRPTSSDEEFIASHNTLTKELIGIIEKQNLSIPILLTSSKHADNPNNMYGQSKLETENILISYGNINNVSVMIYRLFHIFGEGCKINYNSVISTWIYNSIHNLPLNIYDRAIAMRYIYVQDVVDEFIKRINNHDLNQIYYKIDIFYDTTLGEVIDYLDEFKKNLVNPDYYIQEENEFKKKLYAVYLDYYKNTRN